MQGQRLRETISKAMFNDQPVQYDDNAARPDSPTKKLRDRFKNMK